MKNHHGQGPARAVEWPRKSRRAALGSFPAYHGLPGPFEVIEPLLNGVGESSETAFRVVLGRFAGGGKKNNSNGSRWGPTKTRRRRWARVPLQRSEEAVFGVAFATTAEPQNGTDVRR